jgi:hypothetical protein
MGTIKQITAPFRSLARFPLFQLTIVVALILFLQAADPASAFGRIFTGLDKLVGATVDMFAIVFNARSFTKSWLTSGFWIGYVYLVCLLILLLARLAFGALVDAVGRHNAFWLRNAIARERGVAAYRAWVPLEKIRPPHIPQPQWEETFAWPASGKPPYPPLAQRLLIGAVINVAVVLAIALALQFLTPFPVLTWFGQLVKLLFG